MTSLLFSFLFILFLVVLALKTNLFHVSGLSKKFLLIGLSLKVLSCYGFIYLYSFTYSDKPGRLDQDAGDVFQEAYIVQSVFTKNPSLYFKLMFGQSVISEDLQKYLGATSHWSQGGSDGFSENQNLLRVHAIISIFARGNVYFHFFVMLVLTLFSIKMCLIWIKERIPELNLNFVFMILVVSPSVLFWSSSILREPIILLGISSILIGFFSKRFTLKRFLIGCIGILALISFKMYVAFYVVIFLFAFVLLRIENILLKRSFFISIALAIISFCIIPNPFRNKLVSAISRKQYDFINVARGGYHIITETNFIYIAGAKRDLVEVKNDSLTVLKEIDARTYPFQSDAKFSYIRLFPDGKKWKLAMNETKAQSYFEITPIHNSGIQLIKNIPSALVNAVFRPFFWDKGNFYSFICSLELIVIFISINFSFLYKRNSIKAEQNLWLAYLIASLSLLILIGLTTPVSGAIVRYRIPILYLLLPLLFIRTKFTENQQKWINKWFV